MSQHVYTLTFTIVDAPVREGKYLYSSEEHDLHTESLAQVMNEAGETKEDLIKKKIEERIKQVIPAESGAFQVVFDSLEESE